jgi:hypothetical protein
VENQTASEFNEQIRQQTQASVEYYAAHPELISQRLTQLDREWDVERYLQLNSATLSLAGLILAQRNLKWLVLPLGVQAFFLQHGVQGWCPPLPLFRRAGVRTAREIEIERHALKSLRGDYRGSQEADGARALEAARADSDEHGASKSGLVAPTTERVPLNTESAVNRQIEADTERQVSSTARQANARDARLKELSGEWDIERTIEVEAPTMSLIGLALGATVSRKWLAVPIIAQSMMLLHALQGFYPLLPVFRRLGIRTEDEIASERYAIKALRGDFEAVGEKNTRSTGKTAFQVAEELT